MPDYSDDYTPDFMTPGQIAANRGYAKALMEGGYTPISGTSGPVTAVSPLSPLVQMASALYGRQQMNQAGSEERASMIAPNRAMTSGPIPGEDYARGGGGAQAEGTAPWEASIPAIAEIESGGNPNAQTGSHKGIFQLSPSEAAKYGGYGADAGIAALRDKAGQLRGILGREPTGAEVYLAHQQGIGGFQAHMSNPDGLAWQNMARTAEGQQRGAAWARQAIWDNVPDNMKARFGSVDHITSRDFTNMWMHRVESGSFDRSHSASPPLGGQQGDFGSPQAPQGGQQASAMQFAGPGASAGPVDEVSQAAAPGAQEAIALALRGGGVNPPGPGMPSTAAPGKAAPGEGGEGAVPSGFFLPRQKISREQFISVMSNPYASKEMKDYVANSYFGQFQPTQMQGPFGWTVTRDARGNQMWIPPAPHWGEVHAGGISVPRAQYPTPGGGMVTMGGGAGPVTQGPKSSGANVPPATGYDIGGGDNDIGGGTPAVTPKPQSQAEPEGKPVQTAALEAGTVSDAGAPGLTRGPPTAAPALANKPPVQTAQATQSDEGSLSGMTDQQLINFEQKSELAKKRSAEDLKRYGENLDKYQSTARDARTSIPQIELAQKLFNNKNLIQGPWADFKQGYNDFWTALTSDQQAHVSTSLAQEVDKLVSSGILNTMRQTLGGLGQIRLAEIQLLNRASASRYNTPEANAAILFLAKRLAQRSTDIGQLTQDYDQGVRWDENGKRTTSNSDEIPTSSGQNAAINTYMKKHPTLTDEEETQIEHTLNDAPHTRRPKAAAAAPAHSTNPDDYTSTKPGG